MKNLSFVQAAVLGIVVALGVVGTVGYVYWKPFVKTYVRVVIDTVKHDAESLGK